MKTLYITNSNYFKLIINIPIIDNKTYIEYNFIDNEIGFGLDESFLFSKFEKRRLLIIKNICLNLEEFLLKNRDLLNKIKNKNIDKYKLFNTVPHYHEDPECKYIRKEYKNYILDKNIPKEKIDEYRKWVFKNLKMFREDLRTFGDIHQKKWGKNINFPIIEEKKNSGLTYFSLKDLENYIKHLEKEVLKNGMKELVRNSYLSIKKDEDIKSRDVILNKEKLKEIHRKKSEIYRFFIKLNEKANIKNIKLLEFLGFEPCSKCVGSIR